MSKIETVSKIENVEQGERLLLDAELEAVTGGEIVVTKPIDCATRLKVTMEDIIVTS